MFLFIERKGLNRYKGARYLDKLEEKTIRKKAKFI